MHRVCQGSTVRLKTTVCNYEKIFTCLRSGSVRGFDLQCVFAALSNASDIHYIAKSIGAPSNEQV